MGRLPLVHSNKYANSTIINGITPALIDNMFIVNPPSEVKQAIEEELADEQNEDQGLLDIDF